MESPVLSEAETPRLYEHKGKTRFCSPRCGRHCHKSEFDFVNLIANKAMGTLGKGPWRIDLFESAGHWDGRLVSDHAMIIIRIARVTKEVSYTALVNLGAEGRQIQFSAISVSAFDALKNAVDSASAALVGYQQQLSSLKLS